NGGEFDFKDARRREGGVFVFFDKGNQPVGIDSSLLAQLHCKLVAFTIYRNDAHCCGECAKTRKTEEVIDGSGSAAVTIFQLFIDARKLRLGRSRRDALVCSKTLAHIGDVVFGDADIDAYIDARRNLFVDRFSFKLLNRPLQHSAVEIETYRFNMARLLAAQ